MSAAAQGPLHRAQRTTSSGPTGSPRCPSRASRCTRATDVAVLVTDGLKGSRRQARSRAPPISTPSLGSATSVRRHDRATRRPSTRRCAPGSARTPTSPTHVVDATVLHHRHVDQDHGRPARRRVRAGAGADARRPHLRRRGRGAADDIFEGTYQGPNFQQGDSAVLVDGRRHRSARPAVQRMETLRIAFTVPKGDPPAAGWPVVIYQHGTGGDYMSFVGDGSGREAANVTDAAGAAHRRRWSMIAPIRCCTARARPPAPTSETAFFNFLNLAPRARQREAGRARRLPASCA